MSFKVITYVVRVIVIICKEDFAFYRIKKSCSSLFI